MRSDAPPSSFMRKGPLEGRSCFSKHWVIAWAMFQPDPWGILAIIAVAMSWTLAIVTFRASMAGSVGRKLSLLLVIEGLTLASSSAPLFILRYRAEFLDAHPLYAQFTNYLHLFGDCAMLALYPVFLSVALDTQLTRPFTRRDMRAALAAVAVSLYALVAFTPWQMEGVSLLFLCLMATFIYAFTASFLAWRTATGLARSRAFVFVLAFGFRDLCWGYNYAYATVEMWLGRVPLAEGVDTGFMAYILGTLVAVPLIAYGILRTQLFDIDLRIRWTIKQSTFAACVVLISFVVSEGVEWLVSSTLGNLWGLVAAAVAVLFLRPLQQVSERVVSVIMPNTRDTPGYKRSRKLEVYESMYAEAMQEGGISAKERAMLNRLRESLELAGPDAEAVEQAWNARSSVVMGSESSARVRARH